MPQIDRHRVRIVPLEYISNELLDNSPIEDRMKLILVSLGSASILINNKVWSIKSPAVICLSVNDSYKVLNSNRFVCKSFNFHPGFLNSSFTFNNLKKREFTNLEDQHDSNLLQLFLNHSEKYSGILNIPPSMYLKISEWISIMGSETLAQSDGMWTCRIRRYLLQTLYLLEDIYMRLKCSNFVESEASVNCVDIVLEYIHTNYQNDISLDTLTKVAGLNRTSLNKKFRERTGSTLINYLINHRVKIACEALGHTNIPLWEIAASCGFVYESYFIKQFNKIIGESPTEYRKRIHNFRMNR